MILFDICHLCTFQELLSLYLHISLNHEAMLFEYGRKPIIFMPPDRMIGGIFLSCLFVCLLSTLTFAITFEP